MLVSLFIRPCVASVLAVQGTVSPRVAFVDAHPELAIEHRDAQRAMFGAARTGRLSYSRDLQIRGMNEALGLRGSARIESRRELSIEQMQTITSAIEAGAFEDDWTLRRREVPALPRIELGGRTLREAGIYLIERRFGWVMFVLNARGAHDLNASFLSREEAMDALPEVRALWPHLTAYEVSA